MEPSVSTQSTATLVCVQKDTGEHEYTLQIFHYGDDSPRDQHVKRVPLCARAVGCSATSPPRWCCPEQVRVTTTTVPTAPSVLSKTRIQFVSVSMVTKVCTARGWSVSTSSIGNLSCRSPPTSLQSRPIYHYRYTVQIHHHRCMLYITHTHVDFVCYRSPQMRTMEFCCIKEIMNTLLSSSTEADSESVMTPDHIHHLPSIGTHTHTFTL